MTQINLPNLSVTGANLWSQVEDNDKAIRDVVNGNLDATNLADDAVTAAKLRDDASTDANRAVTTNHIRDGAVTTAKLAAAAATLSKVDLFTGGSWAWNTPIVPADVTEPTVLASVPNVPPGTYFVAGVAGTTAPAGIRWWFRTSGGTATITVGPSTSSQPVNSATLGGTGNAAPASAQGIVTVTATTTIQMVGGNDPLVFALNRGLTVIGIKS